jgi:signal transduction histidine kinase
VIEIRLYPCRKNQACIDISDTGSGISPDMLARVFDPFISTKSRGTGLGLSIVQQLINAYGGLVNIESTPGAGTAVTLRLPTHQPADPARGAVAGCPAVASALRRPRQNP